MTVSTGLLYAVWFTVSVAKLVSDMFSTWSTYGPAAVSAEAVAAGRAGSAMVPAIRAMAADSARGWRRMGGRSFRVGACVGERLRGSRGSGATAP
ncbi:hypothetical protein GCM10020229_64160 [Kitasatospora albolonga]